MDLWLSFLLFFSSLFAALWHGSSIIGPLLIGLLAFSGVALRRGHKPSAVFSMITTGSKKSFVVLRIFALIGILTAVWRACGTIAFIVDRSIALLSPDWFILCAFLLSCFVSLLLGSSFGTVGTIGVVLMVMAKSGQVDSNMAAGAIIAGAYFGDRCSPMSSSAHLIAAFTATDLYRNLKNMLTTSLLPLALALAGYAYLSHLSPLTVSGSQLSHEIAQLFALDTVVFIPALLLLLLTLCKVDVKAAMSASIVCAIVVGCTVQQIPPAQMLRYIVVGYASNGDGTFAAIIGGGGLYSMLNAALIVVISSAYAGIFSAAGLLLNLERGFSRCSRKIGLTSTTILAGTIAAAFSCNQTLAIMLTHQFLHNEYAQRQLSPYRLAVDLENTVVVISPLIPWNIAGAFPAATLAVDSSFLPYALYLFLLPLCALFTSACCKNRLSRTL